MAYEMGVPENDGTFRELRPKNEKVVNEIPDEDYDAFLQEVYLEADHFVLNTNNKTVDNFELGDIVILKDGRKGEVKYIGPVKSLNDEMIGIQLESSSPDANDGTYEDTRYWNAAEGTGLFVDRLAIISVVPKVAIFYSRHTSEVYFEAISNAFKDTELSVVAKMIYEFAFLNGSIYPLNFLEQQTKHKESLVELSKHHTVDNTAMVIVDTGKVLAKFRISRNKSGLLDKSQFPYMFEKNYYSPDFEKLVLWLFDLYESTFPDIWDKWMSKDAEKRAYIRELCRRSPMAANFLSGSIYY